MDGPRRRAGAVAALEGIATAARVAHAVMRETPHHLVAGRVRRLGRSRLERSHGVGRELLSELTRRARAAGCHAIDLDSGVHRPDAHRFYMRERLAITSFHFGRTLP